MINWIFLHITNACSSLLIVVPVNMYIGCVLSEEEPKIDSILTWQKSIFFKNEKKHTEICKFLLRSGNFY
jgi:hypothetical protein